MLLLSALASSVAPLDSLHILSLTPSASASSESVLLAGHEAITITFSHAVIPLGADFAPGRLPDEFTPLTITPAVDGQLRWVTTSVARFDPAGVGWPPELDVTVAVSPMLRAFDGRALDAAAHRWSFRTPELSMSAGRVHSPLALSLTNGSWSASLHPLAPGALAPSASPSAAGAKISRAFET
jgi:hypothetical protein